MAARPAPCVWRAWIIGYWAFAAAWIATATATAYAAEPRAGAASVARLPPTYPCDELVGVAIRTVGAALETLPTVNPMAAQRVEGLPDREGSGVIVAEVPLAEIRTFVADISEGTKDAGVSKSAGPECIGIAVDVADDSVRVWIETGPHRRARWRAGRKDRAAIFETRALDRHPIEIGRLHVGLP